MCNVAQVPYLSFPGTPERPNHLQYFESASGKRSWLAKIWKSEVFGCFLKLGYPQSSKFESQFSMKSTNQRAWAWGSPLMETPITDQSFEKSEAPNFFSSASQGSFPLFANQEMVTRVGNITKVSKAWRTMEFHGWNHPDLMTIRTIRLFILFSDHIGDWPMIIDEAWKSSMNISYISLDDEPMDFTDFTKGDFITPNWWLKKRWFHQACGFNGLAGNNTSGVTTTMAAVSLAYDLL